MSTSNKRKRQNKKDDKQSESDVDDQGNIKDLIDYDNDDIEDGDDEEDLDFTDSDEGEELTEEEANRKIKEMLFPFLLLGKEQGVKKEINHELKEKVKNLSLSASNIEMLLKKLNTPLEDKLRTWFDNLLTIPFGKYSSNDSSSEVLPVLKPILKPILKKRKLTLNRQVPREIIQIEKENELIPFLNNAIKMLDKHIYGMVNVKEEIISYVTQIKFNNKPKILALHGNPGVGKTEIARNGLANVLGKNIACINCGGIKDSSYLSGFDYTYQGSRYGKIVECLINSKQMDPVIFIDELDKISDTSEGREIENMLIHILDPTQNNDFRDKYFSDIPIDLSRVLFVIAFNNIKNISPILLDRIHIITIEDPNIDMKINISKLHLLPKLFQTFPKIEKDEIIISDDVVKYIVNTYTKESGVRSLSRCFDKILSRLHVLKLIGKDVDKFKFSFCMNLTFPLKLTNDIVDKILKTNEKDESNNMSYKMMYM